MADGETLKKMIELARSVASETLLREQTWPGCYCGREMLGNHWICLMLDRNAFVRENGAVRVSILRVNLATFDCLVSLLGHSISTKLHPNCARRLCYRDG